MVRSPVRMEQSSKRFTVEFFRHCRGLTTIEDSRASWDNGCNGQNKTTIKWFVEIENTTKP